MVGGVCRSANRCLTCGDEQLQPDRSDGRVLRVMGGYRLKDTVVPLNRFGIYILTDNYIIGKYTSARDAESVRRRNCGSGRRPRAVAARAAAAWPDSARIGPFVTTSLGSEVAADPDTGRFEQNLGAG